MSLGIGTLATHQKQDPVIIPPATVTAAANGVSLSGTTVVLGNDVNDGLQPARLSSSREIPMNTFNVFFRSVSGVNTTGFRVAETQCQFENSPVNRRFTFNSSSILFFSFSPSTTSLEMMYEINAGVEFFNIHKGGSSNGCRVDTTNGRIFAGDNTTVPTARVHIIAGTAGVGNAPFKYIAGVAAQTVLENGAKNFNGSNEFMTAGGVNYTMAKTLTATASLNFPNTAAQTSSDLTITVTGAADGDVVALGVPIASQNADSCFTAFVSAANTVTVRFNNYSAAPIDPATGTFRVSVIKY